MTVFCGEPANLTQVIHTWPGVATFSSQSQPCVVFPGQGWET